MALNNPAQEKIIDATNGTYIDNKFLKLGTPLTENTNIEGTSQTFSISSNLSGDISDSFRFLIGDIGKGQDGIQLYYDSPTLNDATAAVTINDEADILLTSDSSSGLTEIRLNSFDGISIKTDNNEINLAASLGVVVITADSTQEGLKGFFDYSPNYTDLSYVQKKYIDDLVSTIGQSFSEQTHTTGTAVTINNTSTILYVNPVSTLASLTITLPAAPVNGQEVKISFGGTITAGSVVTLLMIEGNTGHTILSASSITTASAGEGYIFKFQAFTNIWRIF